MDYDNNKIAISKIGLGCVTFGREIDQNTSFELMDHAVANGITHFDTAAAYSAGISERIVGEWLSKHKEVAGSISVATKILPPFNPEQIRESVEQSLERLGISTIDILYLHRWDKTLEAKEALDVLSDLVKEGKIRKLGASNFTSEQLKNTIALQAKTGNKLFQFIQNNHNLAVSDIDESVKQICISNNINIITYSPLGAGFLTGKHQHGVEAGSRFAIMPAHQDVYFNEHAYQRLERLQQVALRTGYTASHLALAWAIHQPGVSSVLIGSRTIQHLDQAIKAMEFFSPDIFAELEDV